MEGLYWDRIYLCYENKGADRQSRAKKNQELINLSFVLELFKNFKNSS